MEELRMRLSREKMVHLSHVVADALEGAPGVELLEPKNDVRLRLFAIIQEEVKAEAQLDLAVRKKITSQKRNIVEGSEEWDVLYRQYYREEMDRRGKVR